MIDVFGRLFDAVYPILRAALLMCDGQDDDCLAFNRIQQRVGEFPKCFLVHVRPDQRDGLRELNCKIYRPLHFRYEVNTHPVSALCSI